MTIYYIMCSLNFDDGIFWDLELLQISTAGFGDPVHDVSHEASLESPKQTWNLHQNEVLVCS